MPPLRTRSRILRIRKRLKPIRQKLLRDRQNFVCRLGHEIRNRHQISRMSIDERFVPGCGGIVLDLDDVGKGD